MAQHKKAVCFKNAVIDATAGTITEISKDGESEYKISDVLHEFDGIDGINLTIQQTNEF